MSTGTISVCTVVPCLDCPDTGQPTLSASAQKFSVSYLDHSCIGPCYSHPDQYRLLLGALYTAGRRKERTLVLPVAVPGIVSVVLYLSPHRSGPLGKSHKTQLSRRARKFTLLRPQPPTSSNWPRPLRSRDHSPRSLAPLCSLQGLIWSIELERKLPGPKDMPSAMSRSLAGRAPAVLRHGRRVPTTLSARNFSLAASRSFPRAQQLQASQASFYQKRLFQSSAACASDIAQQAPNPKAYLESGVIKSPEAVNVKKVLVIGSGGLAIGQAGEFDYSGSFTLTWREARESRFPQAYS